MHNEQDDSDPGLQAIVSKLTNELQKTKISDQV